MCQIASPCRCPPADTSVTNSFVASRFAGFLLWQVACMFSCGETRRMSAHISLSTSYRIEISGWDVEQNFFVGRANLAWSEEQGKKGQLRNPLRNGAEQLYLLIAPPAPGHSFPIAIH